MLQWCRSELQVLATPQLTNSGFCRCFGHGRSRPDLGAARHIAWSMRWGWSKWRKNSLRSRGLMMFCQLSSPNPTVDGICSRGHPSTVLTCHVHELFQEAIELFGGADRSRKEKHFSEKNPRSVEMRRVFGPRHRSHSGSRTFLAVSQNIPIPFTSSSVYLLV